MLSFDIVSEVNKIELKNAVDQANKKNSNRFDFKGMDARIEQYELALALDADDDFKLKQVTGVFLTKCAKRGVDARMPDTKNIEKIGTKMKQLINVKLGIEQKKAKAPSRGRSSPSPSQGRPLSSPTSRRIRSRSLQSMSATRPTPASSANSRK